ncbi:helix-turn-helix domain-containing protein [Olsenella uli]|uniref:helix-turn-helix domain-containing protein n=1 Tax=Olsenella uli TaxID=133926 RepID=UPI00138AB1C8|nr:LexA family transcriptional regulator [Olsenella uli]
MNFSQRIRALREGADLTQTELAEKLGLTSRAVGAWETGRSKPRLDKLEQLAELLGTTSYYLLNGDGPKTIEVRPTSATVPLQVLGVTCMGDGDEQEADAIVEVPEGVAMRHPSMFVVHGIGPCMSRRFPEDAILGVDPSIGPRTGDVVLARDEAHGSFVHVYLAGSGGTVMLSADSWEEGFEDIVVGPRDPPVEVLGVVVWYQAYEDVRR